MNNFLTICIIALFLLYIITTFCIKYFNEIFFNFGLIVSRKKYKINKKYRMETYYKEIEFKKINEKKILFVLYHPGKRSRKPFVEYFGYINIKDNNLSIAVKVSIFEIPMIVIMIIYGYYNIGIYNIKNNVIFFGGAFILLVLLAIKRIYGINKINNIIHELYCKE
jgi:hypothetical protein